MLHYTDPLCTLGMNPINKYANSIMAVNRFDDARRSRGSKLVKSQDKLRGAVRLKNIVNIAAFVLSVLLSRTGLIELPAHTSYTGDRGFSG